MTERTPSPVAELARALVGPAGARHRCGRPAPDRGRGCRGARPSARHAPLRLRPRPVRRERAAPPGGAGRDRAAVPGPVRAQGEPAARDPRGVPRARRAGDAREHRHRCLLTGRSRARHRVRLAPRRDQLHGHERLRARPRRPARARDPPQPRRDQPDRALWATRAGDGDRDPDRPGRRRRLQRAPRVRRGPADQVRHRPGAARRRHRGGSAPPAADRHGPFPCRIWLARGRSRGVRARPRAGGHGRRAAARRRSRDHRSQRRWRARCSGAAGRARGRPRRIRGGPGAASRPAWGDHRLRARRSAHQGRRDPPRRGRHGRAAARCHVRRSRHRLERELLVLHLPVRPGARGLPGGRRRANRGRHRSPAISTRPATSSPRTTRCHPSRRATWSRCSTPAAISRR